ncbi:MAG: cytochrome P450 [Pseudomonadota bacterium]
MSRALAEAFDLAAPPPGFAEDPYPVYRALLEHAPVKRFADGSVMLSRWEDLDRVYRDTARFKSAKFEEFAPKYGRDAPLYEHHTTSLVFNDPPLHTRVRRILAGALTPRAIAAMEPGLIALVDRLLEGLPDEADLIEGFASRIPIEVIGALFDMPEEERGPLRDWSLAILGALEPVLSAEQEAAGNAAVVAFSDYLRDLVARRRAAPGDPATDVLTRLIFAEDGLTEAELLQNCIFILNAGHETTTNLIGNALLSLCDWPEERARLIADPALAETAVDEFLRFQSPNQLGNRAAAEAFEVQGETLPAGTRLHLAIGAANRDPRRFEDPDRLDLGRRPNRHLAFAGGPHTCLGFTLARMEGRVALTRFVQRFPRFAPAGSPRWTGRMRFRGLSELPARLR